MVGTLKDIDYTAMDFCNIIQPASVRMNVP
jgi:hypothetical protein